MTKYVTIAAKEDVTEEIAEAAYAIADGWYQGGQIDWEDVLDRLDGMELENGGVVDLGSNLASPAVKEIKRVVRKMRAAN